MTSELNYAKSEKLENAQSSAERKLLTTAWYHGMAGELAYLRPHAQRHLYNLVTAWSRENPDHAGPMVLLCHRRMGKSWLLAFMALERCLREPGQEVKLGAPTLIQCRDIVRPHIESILDLMPLQLRPDRVGLEYLFRNPLWPPGSQVSRLKLIGCNVQSGDRLRGMAADMVVLDEVREIPNLDYIVRDVIAPQFVGRKNPQLILITTPPKSLDHDLTKPGGWIEEAQALGSYHVIPATLNRDFTERDERILLSLCGSKDSTSWRREALCELISDEEHLIVPELLRAERDIIVSGYPRPARFAPLVGCDTGWSDRTALVFGYVDFRAQILVLERTLLLRYHSTGEVARKCLEVERALWGEKPPYRIRRFADATAQQVADLRRDHGVYFQPCEKHSRHDAPSTIATFRDGVARHRIRIIEDGNKDLIYQLRNGVWNAGRTDFERSERMGHWDAGMAAAYLYRMAPWRLNPEAPARYDPYTQFDPRPQRSSTEIQEAFLSILGARASGPPGAIHALN